uniref:Anthocyanidin 5,3-O-glucosyltransferase n=1 Tax=Triticum urartu TaxID=4572 RepID=A0A8R7JV63_TRIUA
MAGVSWKANGVIINTAAELEQSVVAAIAGNGPTLYPVGPVLSFPAQAEQAHACELWLEAQPLASVVFLCFGSAGFSTAAQAHEVAHGLERSGHRFLWVLRGPPAPDTPLQPTDADLGELLPEGFLERTKGKGLVWPTKAPQKEILGHAAVGGFVTHCGWNSTLESLWFGVPMVPWPLYAEQHLNAFTLVAYTGVAVAMEVDRNRNNFVEASELERAVKALMDADSHDGSKARAKAAEMKAVCRKAVHDGGGSSYTALGRLAQDILR